MNEANVTDATGNTNEKKNNKKPLILLLILALAIGGICAVLWFNQGNNSLDFSEGRYDGLSREEIMEDLNKQVKENEMNVSILTTVIVDEATHEGVVGWTNSVANKYGQMLTIALKDTGEVVYSSEGVLPPGNMVEKIKLTETLSPGTYAAVATIAAADESTGGVIENRGTLSAEMTIVVE